MNDPRRAEQPDRGCELHAGVRVVEGFHQDGRLAGGPGRRRGPVGAGGQDLREAQHPGGLLVQDGPVEQTDEHVRRRRREYLVEGGVGGGEVAELGLLDGPFDRHRQEEFFRRRVVRRPLQRPAQVPQAEVVANLKAGGVGRGDGLLGRVPGPEFEPLAAAKAGLLGGVRLGQFDEFGRGVLLGRKPPGEPFEHARGEDP